MNYFKDQIVEDTDEGVAAKWVFDPSKLREVFYKAFDEEDFEELQELVDEATNDEN